VIDLFWNAQSVPLSVSKELVQSHISGFVRFQTVKMLVCTSAIMHRFVTDLLLNGTRCIYYKPYASCSTLCYNPRQSSRPYLTMDECFVYCTLWFKKSPLNSTIEANAPLI